MSENFYYLGFSIFPGIGPAKLTTLLKKFGTAENAWNGSKKKLEEVLGEKLAGELVEFRKEISLEKNFEEIKKMEIEVVTIQSDDYPKLLKSLKNPPFLLYVKGNIEILNSPKIIAVVGTRKITPYGKQITEMLTQELVSMGFVIVSGLAYGVDAAAHRATINSGGKTIAVLGCGVDYCYPPGNQKLYNDILASGGAIVSTMTPKMEPTVGSFPARNAIIAGLSLGTLVTEGASDSGALITASDAASLQRPVFAIPGPITSSLSIGPNSLLKNGAIPVTTGQDILDKLGIMGFQKVQVNRKIRLSDLADSAEELIILKLLDVEALHFDEIVRRIGKDSKVIGSLLSFMELKGIVKSNSQGEYFLNF